MQEKHHGRFEAANDMQAGVSVWGGRFGGGRL